MEKGRTKNATRNIVFGVVLKIYQILVPFIMRTAMIYFMGVEYLGLNSLFTSILQVLNLAELGVGSAMTYSMYKPIIDNDKKRINALLHLYRTYYRVIGLVIAVVGIILLPFVPILVKSDLPKELNIYILYLLNLGTTVLSYWLFAYKDSLLQAYQRMDIVSKVTLFTTTIQYGLQFLIMWLLKDYYIYIIVALATQALTNILTAVAANKMYPQYKVEGNLDKQEIKDINHRIRDLFTSRIGMVIVNSADTIVISAFLGLTILAVYQNYYFILTAVIGVVGIIFQACTAGIGNSIIIESDDKNFNDLKKFTFIISWISGFCVTCFLNLFQPFMEIWVGKDLLLGFSAVICFCIYYFIYEINQLLNTYKDAAGIWHEDRFRPLVTALVNLGLNIVMVQFMGIYGVILSTVISTFLVGMPWLLYNLFTVLFAKKYLKPYLKQILLESIIMVVGCCVTYGINNFIKLPIWPTLIVRGVICLIVPNILYFCVYRNTKEFKDSMILANNMTKNKISIFEKLSK